MTRVESRPTGVESRDDVGARGCHSRPQRPPFTGHVVLLQIKPSGSEHENEGFWNDTFTITCVACNRRFRAIAA